MREAVAADVDGIVAMGARFWQGSVYADRLVTVDPRCVAALATRLMDSPDGLVLIAETGNGLVGMLAACVFDHFFSGLKTCGEIAWWVDPGHRGIGLRLLRAAERWGRNRGAVRMQMIAPTADVERIYTRLGYAPMERTFEREL